MTCPPKTSPPFKLEFSANEPHPKAVPRKLEISGRNGFCIAEHDK